MEGPRPNFPSAIILNVDLKKFAEDLEVRIERKKQKIREKKKNRLREKGNDKKSSSSC